KETEEDHADLASALGMVKEVIAAVDSKVNEYEKKARLNEIYNKTDSKSIMRMKTGQMFAKEDLKRRKLVHDGPVLLKNSAGRFKEVQAVLLSDVLVFLQEKDQKYVFPALDQKSTVISLKKLIVREVANQEKGLFLITVGTADAEMVEVYANSKEERNNWMQRIQQTTNRIEKDEDEGIPSESEEDRRVLETKAREMREQLKQRDQQILSLLQEKGKIFREMADCGGQDEGDQSPASRILFRANSEDIPKGEIVMTDALKEVESLQGFVDRALGGTLGQQSPTSSEQEGIVGPVSLPRRAETFGGFDSHQMNTSKNGDKDEGEEGQELRRTESDSVLKKGGNANLATLVKKTNEQVLQSVTRLYNLLSTLQAVVVQQDSFIEDQRLALSERSLTRSSSRPNSLIEQEKQRSLEKQRQELANLQKQQAQHLEEKRKREREWEMRERELTGREARLTQSREQVDRDREQLEREKEELQAKKEEYQHDLERLRAAQKQLEKGQEQVARDRERLAQKQMEASCQMSNQHSKGTRTSCGFLNSEDPKWHSSSSLEKEDSETSVLPKMDAPCRTDCKQKGKNFMPFGLLGSANQANKQSEGQNPAQARFLQLAKPKEKKEKKKKKSKGHRSQPADAHTSEPAAEGEEIFC
uniref:PH domain-containing protein n=2 Tax=Latimeria chalumnae TaxID=7897 RepID=H3B4M2_LATCH